jgi:hypothetical protein
MHGLPGPFTQVDSPKSENLSIYPNGPESGLDALDKGSIGLRCEGARSAVEEHMSFHPIFPRLEVR